MKFEEFYEIKVGLPVDRLPTFRYNTIDELGVYGETKFGSIRPRFPVEAYAPDIVEKGLEEWLRVRYETEPHLIRCALILDKGTTLDAIRDYVMSAIETVTIDTGVVLQCEGNQSVLRTISAHHRPEKDDEVYAFAADIEKLRRLQSDAPRVSSGIQGEAGPLLAPMSSVEDLYEKYKHRFGTRADVAVEKNSLLDYLQRIYDFTRQGVHLRRVALDSSGLFVELGNSSLYFKQRAKSTKVTVTSDAGDGVAALNYVAQSPRTIDQALADVLTIEMVFMQTGNGYYNTRHRVQYNCQVLIRWLKKLSTKYGLHMAYSEKGDTDIHEILWQDSTVAVRMSVKFLHTEIDFAFINGMPTITLFIRHSSDQMSAQKDVETQLAIEYQGARNGK